MSVEAMTAVLHHSSARGTDKLVLLGIANHAGDGGAWPALATLARYANVDERNVRKALGRLSQAGELRVHVQDGGRHDTPQHMRPNRYDVLVTCPPGCDRSTQHRVKPLPQAPADLWIEGGTTASPGDDSVPRGGTPASPDPLTPASPEPSLQPTDDSGTRSVTGPRASARDDADLAGDPAERTPTCAECSAPNMASCYRRQMKLNADDRHRYRPVIR